MSDERRAEIEALRSEIEGVLGVSTSHEQAREILDAVRGIDRCPVCKTPIAWNGERGICVCDGRVHHRVRDARGRDEPQAGPGWVCGCGRASRIPPSMRQVEAARFPQGEDHELRKLMVDWTENGDPVLLDPSVGPPHPVVGTHDLPAPKADEKQEAR